jgi:integrase
MKKLTTSFYLKGDKLRNGESAIYIKINVGSSSSTMSTGHYIKQERWKETNMLLTAKKISREISLKNFIYEIPSKLDVIYLELMRLYPDKIIDAKDVKDTFLGKSIVEEKKKITLIDVANYHINHFLKRVEKAEVTDGTEKKYKRVVRIFQDFLEYKKMGNNVNIEDMADILILDFDDYLRYERPNGKEKKGVVNNTAVKYIRNLKTIFNFCLKRKYITSNPFDVYETKLEEVETVFLTPPEFKKINDVVLSSKKLETVRDIFLFSCYTSYAPCDAMNLTINNIDLDMDGEQWIRTKRQKSGVKSDIIILPPVLEIINKYKNDPRCIESGRLLPKYSNQKINEYLKEIADLAGIRKHLTWYVSRHTFATTVCLSNKMPLEYISACMGHKKITQTQHYAKLLDGALKTETLKLKQIYA